MIRHMRQSTRILWLMIPILGLVTARSLVHTNGQTLDTHPVSKQRGVVLGLSEHAGVHAAGHGNPYVNLRDGNDLVTTYVGEAAPVQMLQQGKDHPASLASADFDEDGVPDLVSGYSIPRRGLLALYRGNLDSIFPNAPEAKQHKAEGLFVDAPFLPSAKIFAGPEPADFLQAGDFDGDGHWDVVTAARGSALLLLFSGNGRGNLSFTKSIQLPGTVTELVGGDLNRRDGLTDLAVGVSGVNGSQVLVFESPLGAMRGEPEVLSVSAEVTAIAIGQLDEDYPIDVAVAAGRELLTIHGRDRKLSLDEAERRKVPKAILSKQSLDSRIISIALGNFTNERRKETAVLLNNGEVRLVGDRSQKPESRSRDRLFVPDEWIKASHLVRAKVSSLPHDDLLLVDPANHQIHILGGEKEKESTDRVAMSVDVDGEPMAVLPMQLNVDALQDLVVLKKGQNSLTVAMTASMSTFVVNSTGHGSDCDVNDGVCSLGTLVQGQCVLTNECTLSAAIQQANASAGLDTISFAIGSGTQTITLPGLPPVDRGPVVIDGTTQPGFLGTPIIELNGNNPETGSIGLDLLSGNSSVRGLVINRFGYGMYLARTSSTSGTGNTVQGNFIGTDVNGTADLGNAYGIIVYTSDHTIGGTTAAARNLISGNNNIFGILISDAANNVVQGNFIGTDINGTADLGNSYDGVAVLPNTTNNVIGGTTAGTRNIISGNDRYGVLISNNAAGNQVQGNYIGTDVTGTADLGNASDGVSIWYSVNNTIGGTTGQARNVISGNNNSGILINGGAATGNQVQGNYVGTRADGISALGNGAHGVSVSTSASNNTIGGNSSAGWNRIQQNAGDGVYVDFGAQNAIVGNSIVGNAGLGIDLGANGVNGNDPGDGDSGANNLQNFPVLTSVSSVGNNTTVHGTLNSTPNTSFTLSFYSNSQCDASGFGEGQTFIGSASVTSDSAGNANLNLVLPVGLHNAELVTATATDASNNTSEFSACRAVATQQFNLKVELKGTGSGLVASTPIGIFCNGGPTGCQHSFDGTVSLQASPSGSSIFLQWDKDCTGPNPRCDVAMDRAKFVDAYFVDVGFDELSHFQRPIEGYRYFIAWQLRQRSAVALPKPVSTSKELRTTRAINAPATLPPAAVPNVKIELSRDGGATFETLFASTPNDESECWLVSGSATTQALLRISSADNSSITGNSPHTFEIAKPGNGGATTGVNVGAASCGDLSAADGRSQIRGNSFYADRYSFAGSTGQQIAVTLTSQSVDTYVYLLAPDGSVIAEDNNGGGGTDSRIPATSGFFALPATGTYVIEATSFAANSLGDYQLRLESGPLLLTAENTERAIALDSVIMIRDPFPLLSTLNFSSDHRTRVSLFAVNLELLPGENSSVVTAQAEDSQHRVYPLTVEYVGRVPNFGGLSQVNVRLPDELANAGDVWVSTSLRGVVGNRALINVR